jgi:hypothetical protein
MRNTICKMMPKEVEMMGATFSVVWFYRAACKYVNLQSTISTSHRECDVTDLVLAAITIGLEREEQRIKLGKESLANRPEVYLRRAAYNLVHEAARKEVKWYKRNSQSPHQAEAELWEFELRNGATQACVQGSPHDGLFGLFPVEEIFSNIEEAEDAPLAKKKVTK